VIELINKVRNTKNQSVSACPSKEKVLMEGNWAA